MIRGHTTKEFAEGFKRTHNMLKATFGEDYTSKAKSMRRNEWRDYPKEAGQGDASLRRFITKKYLAKKMK